MASAVILGMIVTMFPEPAEQAKAIGVYSFVASAGASIGLLAGGVLTQAINWHWIFFVNVPIGIVHGARSHCACSRTRPGIGLRQGADVPGAAARDRGADARRLHDRRGRRPRLGLAAHARARRGRDRAAGRVPRPPGAARSGRCCRCGCFRSRNVAGANLVQVLMVAGLFGMFFLGALYLQRVLGYDAIEIGLAFLPVSLGIGILSLGFSAAAEPALRRAGGAARAGSR